MHHIPFSRAQRSRQADILLVVCVRRPAFQEGLGVRGAPAHEVGEPGPTSELTRYDPVRQGGEEEKVPVHHFDLDHVRSLRSEECVREPFRLAARLHLLVRADVLIAGERGLKAGSSGKVSAIYTTGNVFGSGILRATRVQTCPPLDKEQGAG